VLTSLPTCGISFPTIQNLLRALSAQLASSLSPKLCGPSRVERMPRVANPRLYHSGPQTWSDSGDSNSSHMVPGHRCFHYTTIRLIWEGNRESNPNASTLINIPAVADVPLQSLPTSVHLSFSLSLSLSSSSLLSSLLLLSTGPAFNASARAFSCGFMSPLTCSG